jgi:hypothetical protein
MRAAAATQRQRTGNDRRQIGGRFERINLDKQRSQSSAAAHAYGVPHVATFRRLSADAVRG